MRVRGLVLQASFKAVRGALREALHATRPALVVGLGLNPSTRTVDVELAAVNRAFFTQPDVDGYVASYEEVESGGPFTVYTTLPVMNLHRSDHVIGSAGVHDRPMETWDKP